MNQSLDPLATGEEFDARHLVQTDNTSELPSIFSQWAHIPTDSICLQTTTEGLGEAYWAFGQSPFATALRSVICTATGSSIRAAQSGRFEALREMLDIYTEELSARKQVTTLGAYSCRRSLLAGLPAEDACYDTARLSATTSAGFRYPPQAELLQEKLRRGEGLEELEGLTKNPAGLLPLTSLVENRELGREILSRMGYASDFQATVPFGELPAFSTALLDHAREHELFHVFLCKPPSSELTEQEVARSHLFVDSVNVLASRTYGSQIDCGAPVYRDVYSQFMFWLWLSDNTLDRYNNSLSNDIFVFDVMELYSGVVSGELPVPAALQAEMLRRNMQGEYGHPMPSQQGIGHEALSPDKASALRIELIENVSNSLVSIVESMKELGLDVEYFGRFVDSHLESHRIEKQHERPGSYRDQMLLRLDSGAIEVCLELSRQLSLQELVASVPTPGLDQASVQLLKHPYAVSSEEHLAQIVQQTLEDELCPDIGAREWHTQVAYAGALLSPLIRQLDDHGNVYGILINDLASFAKDIVEGEGNPLLIEIAQRYTERTARWEDLSRLEMRLALHGHGYDVCTELIHKINERWKGVYAAAKVLRRSSPLVLDFVAQMGKKHGFPVERDKLDTFLRVSLDHLIMSTVFWVGGQNSWNAETPRYQLSQQALIRPLLEYSEGEARKALACLYDALFIPGD